MNNIKNKINHVKEEIKQTDQTIKGWTFIYKFIAYIHIGCAGTFAVNAMKELLVGSLSGLGMFAGLLASCYITCYPFKKIIEKNMQKKSKLETDLTILMEEEYKLKKQKEIQRQIQNQRVKSLHISNNYSYQKDSEMKLSLRK